MINAFRRGKWRERRAVVLTAAMALLLGLVGLAAPSAGAQTQTKYYDVAASPPSIYVGVQTSVTVQLENDPSSTQSFGSAELNFGALPGSAVDLSSFTNTAGWSSEVVSTSPLVVRFTSGSLAGITPGNSLSISFLLTAPTAEPVTIATEVKQSNDFSGHGNDFVNLTGDPTITVTPLTLAFVQQPSTVQQGSRSKPVYMCPPVSVAATEGPSGPGIPGVNVTLSYAGAADPGLYYDGMSVPAAGVGVQTGPDGVATFGDPDCASAGLGAANVGSGFALSASSTAAAGPITSTPFSVVQYDQQCTGSCPPVNLSSSATGTGASITTTGSGTYDLIGSFGQGQLVCDSQVSVGTTDPVLVQAVPVTSGASAYALVTMVFPKSVVNSVVNNGTPLMPVCGGANLEFTGSASYPGASYPYQGLLPDCTSTYLGDPAQFCVASRAKGAGASETVMVYVGSEYASDPMFW